MIIKDLTIDFLRERMETKYGYYSDNMIQYRTFLGLINFLRPDVNRAQDIYSLCLEGPPGVGKTMFAKVYSKLVKDIYGGEVEFVDFTCTKDTGKTELIEEINVMAVVEHDGKRINIPGKIIEAIHQVNSGKKVILFIDEYDKARRETDSFFNSFLQSGSLNAVQHGDLVIKDEFKNNIQVIFCKNDPDVELSEAMQRRVKFIRLDYMTPDRFYTIAKRTLIDERSDDRKVDISMLTLVALIYENCYRKKNDSLFSRLPATSELLIAIEEANDLMTKGNVSGAGIYALLMEDIFKDKDNLIAFESLMKKSQNDSEKNLNKLLVELKGDTNGANKQDKKEMIDMMAELYYTKQDEFLVKRKKELDTKEATTQETLKDAIRAIQKYEKLCKELKSNVQRQSDAGPTQIEVSGLTFDLPGNSECLPNFQDETAHVKRSKSVFGEDSSKRWFTIAKATSKERFNMYRIDKFIKCAAQFKVVVYENGFLFKGTNDIKVIMTRSADKEGNYDYVIWADSLVIPPSLLEVVKQVFDTVKELNNPAKESNDTTKESNDTATLEYSIDCLIYNEGDIPCLERADEDNIYLLSTTDLSIIPEIVGSEHISSIGNLKSKNAKLIDAAMSQGHVMKLNKKME